MTEKPISEEAVSKEFERLRNDFPSFLKQPVEDGIYPPRDWLIQQIQHTPCPQGEEPFLIPHEIYLTILKDTAPDELRARKLAARAKAGVLDRLETLLLVGGIDRGVLHKGLFTLPGDNDVRKDSGQGAWDFCKKAIEKYRNTFHTDNDEKKSLDGGASEPSHILLIPLRLKEMLLAQGGYQDSCQVIDAALGNIELDGTQILGSDLINDDGMIIPRSALELIFLPNLEWRFATKERNSILINFYTNVLVKGSFSSTT